MRLDFVRGRTTGLVIPAHAEALRAAGAEFLTEAFRAFGTLGPDDRVTRIVRCAPFAGGNSGHKLRLGVEYAGAAPGLRPDLFVKFSRDFEDVFRDRRRHELESEVRLATLSRVPAFPVAAPRACFADFEPESGTGLLITEEIAFGQGGIEPLRPKGMDHLLPNALEHYQATVTALARLAAAQMSGRLDPEVDRLFPFDRAAAEAEHPIAYGEAELREKLAGYAAFAKACPRLLPAEFATDEFLARLEREALAALRNQAAIRRFLYADPDFVALCHWNTHLDNAWFWRDAGGELQCGLLDWGLVRRMNVATALWGGLSGASRQIWDDHLDALLARFAGVLGAAGGPALEVAELRLHLDLAVAILGLSLMIDAPALALRRLPRIAEARGPHDPIVLGDPVVHGFLLVFVNFLNLWATHDMAASLEQALTGTRRG